jgi:serine/threonine protein phosphatase 1
MHELRCSIVKASGEFSLTRAYAVGDIHGCLDQLQRLVDRCEQDAASQKSTFIFLGDYIDRGLDSRGVIKFLMDLQKYSPHRIICLRGNHEDLLLRALEGDDAEQHWMTNGADATLNSYRVPRAIDLPSSHIEWIRFLPLFHDDGLRFFVHAGIHPDRRLNEQRSRDLLWIREPFLSSCKDFGRFIVHGHTPVKSGRPDLHPNRLNLDTGAVYGRPLSAAVFDRYQLAPLKFIQA